MADSTVANAGDMAEQEIWKEEAAIDTEENATLVHTQCLKEIDAHRGGA